MNCVTCFNDRLSYNVHLWGGGQTPEDLRGSPRYLAVWTTHVQNHRAQQACTNVFTSYASRVLKGKHEFQEEQIQAVVSRGLWHSSFHTSWCTCCTQVSTKELEKVQCFKYIILTNTSDLEYYDSLLQFTARQITSKRLFVNCRGKCWFVTCRENVFHKPSRISCSKEGSATTREELFSTLSLRTRKAHMPLSSYRFHRRKDFGRGQQPGTSPPPSPTSPQRKTLAKNTPQNVSTSCVTISNLAGAAGWDWAPIKSWTRLEVTSQSRIPNAVQQIYIWTILSWSSFSRNIYTIETQSDPCKTTLPQAHLAKVEIKLEHISKNSSVWWPQGVLSISMLVSELDLLLVLGTVLTELSLVMSSTRCASGCSVVLRLLKSSR